MEGSIRKLGKKIVSFEEESMKFLREVAFKTVNQSLSKDLNSQNKFIIKAFLSLVIHKSTGITLNTKKTISMPGLRYFHY